MSRGFRAGPAKDVKVVLVRVGKFWRWRLMVGRALVVEGLEGSRDAARTAGRLAEEMYERRAERMKVRTAGKRKDGSHGRV